MSDIYIFGAGVLAKLAATLLNPSQRKSFKAFVVDDDYLHLYPSESNIIATTDLKRIAKNTTVSLFCALGHKSMRSRKDVFHRLSALDVNFINIFSDGAILMNDVSIGSNNIFFPGVVVEMSVTIGDNNIFWSNSTICHDTVICSHNFFAANATIGGSCAIGSMCFFGFSSTLFHNLQVQDNVLLAGCACASSSLVSDTRYQGVPAKAYGRIDPAVGIYVE